MRAKAICSAAMILLGSSVVAGCDSPVTDPRVAPPLVRIATVGAAGETGRSFTGVVAARVQSDLGFRVGGKVVARLVDVGQAVRRGQPLMRIDEADLGLAVAAEQANVAAARARSVQAASDAARLDGLVEAGAVSAQAFEAARSAASVARAQVATAEAAARTASNAGGYALLVAPADGVVVEALAEPGQVVAAGQTVLRIAQGGAREARISLPETVRPRLGSIARAAVTGREDAASLATLRELSNAADPQTRTFDARYVLSGPAAQAPLGSTVTLRLTGGAGAGGTGAHSVPLGALYDPGRGPGVWIVDARTSTVRFRPVTIARIGAEDAVLSGGVAPGDRIVALGAHLLSEGQKVRVMTPSVAQASGQGTAR